MKGSGISGLNSGNNSGRHTLRNRNAIKKQQNKNKCEALKMKFKTIYKIKCKISK